MNLNKLTLEVLRNFSAINQNILVKAGNVLRTVSVTDSVVAEATVPDEFPREFAIYDLNELLSVFSLFRQPSINYEESRLVIKEGRSSSAYFYSSPHVVMSPPDDDMPELPSVDAEFTFTKDNLDQLIKASSVMKLKDVGISANGVRVFNTANSSTNEFVIDVEDMVFHGDRELVINIDNLKLMPFNYKVQVSAEGIAMFSSDVVRYFVALEA